MLKTLMKSCPVCNRTYTDLTLSFCMNDGALLSAPLDSGGFELIPPEPTISFEREIETVVSSSKAIQKENLNVELKGNEIGFGEHFKVSLQRTLRIPDDGNNYPLPPGLGEFPVCRVSDFHDRVPESWKEHGGVFIPMYQREAMWIRFSAVKWRPNAVKVAAGKINAVTGKPWNQEISKSEQDYMVCPPQKWIDGFKTGSGVVRQFVAMPLGSGYTVEEQLTGEDEFGGIQIIVFEPKPGIFEELEERPLKSVPIDWGGQSLAIKAPDKELGLAAGGKISQKAYPDTYRSDTWDPNNYGRVFIHIVNSSMFESITGREAPATPISSATYTRYGMPWFSVYDEHMSDVPTAQELDSVKPVGLIDKIKGIFTKEESVSLTISDEQVKKLKVDDNKIEDGDW